MSVPSTILAFIGDGVWRYGRRPLWHMILGFHNVFPQRYKLNTLLNRQLPCNYDKRKSPAPLNSKGAADDEEKKKVAKANALFREVHS